MPFSSLTKLITHKAKSSFNPSRKGKSAKIAIITVTQHEFNAVRNHFDLTANPPTPLSKYFVQDGNANHHDIVLVRAPSQTNIVSQYVAHTIIEDFHPSFIFLIGTAGGHSDRDGGQVKIKLGDVVVSDYVEGSDYVKLEGDEAKARGLPRDHPSVFILEEFVEQIISRHPEWVADIGMQRPVGAELPIPNVHKGQVLSGAGLLGSPSHPWQQSILGRYDKAIAFEMEAMGVAYAVYQARKHPYYNPQYMVIRGVSDYVDRDAAHNQLSRIQWTPYAVRSATVVAARIIRPLLEYLEKAQKAGRYRHFTADDFQ